MSNTIRNDISQIDYHLLPTTYYLLLTFKVLLPLTTLLAGRTLYERIFGTEIANAHLYDALWFKTLWASLLFMLAWNALDARYENAHP